ncbi:PilN domain-containing protein [Lysinibacillus boronitolerans]|uniref:PilN domain-containing protein n=1 Tax=Lysinibacillus boronitolerans TaxID=309788 RepID=UPI00289C66A7|nr:PilN domain-containing protein [Lysinibacillus boronitolerans]
MVPEINLLPSLEKKKSAPTLIYVLLIILVGLVLGYMIFLYIQAKGDLLQLNTQEVELSSQRDQLQLELDVNKQTNKGSLEQSVQFVEKISYPVTPLIDEMQALLPEQTYLRKYAFSENQIEMTSDFESMAAISKYLDKLLASPFFSDVQVSTIDNFDVTGGKAEEVIAQDKFKEIPRYSVTITLAIDTIYLAGGRAS